LEKGTTIADRVLSTLAEITEVDELRTTFGSTTRTSSIR
jgi:hypothetical protein